MVARNDITGDKIQTRDGLSEKGKENWDTIFPPKKKERWVPPPLPNFTEHEQMNMEIIQDMIENPKKKSRIDIIGQNGNDGLHYEKN